MPQSIPNYLTVNPDGTVTAEFSGGIIIPTDPNLPAGQQPKAVTWINNPDGSVVAEIKASKYNNTQAAYFDLGSTNPSLQMTDDGTNKVMALSGTQVGAYGDNSTYIQLVSPGGGSPVLYGLNTIAVSMRGTDTYSVPFAVNQPFSKISGMVSVAGWSSAGGIGSCHAYIVNASNATLTELGSGENWPVTANVRSVAPTLSFKQSVSLQPGGAYKLNIWTPGVTRDGYDNVNALLFFHR